ncbi:hypothetical protein [Streptomyces sp. NPDC057696]|uniref:hypothetical protein n=1 Tax=Streptomyces sp. NPDC057696 TaxID=3346218 RepID=UPI0036B00A18
MDFTAWLPALTAMGAIGAAVITSRTAIRSTEKTTRISLHAAYTAPRITAVKEFLEAVEKGRHGTAPTKETVTSAEAAYLTLRILAFQGTEAAEDVKERASALLENLREMQQTHGAAPPTPGEKMQIKLSDAVSRAEVTKQEAQDAGAEAYAEWELMAKEDYELLRGALDCLEKSHAEQHAAYAAGGRRLETAAAAARKELRQCGELLNMPGLEKAVETGKQLAWRRNARQRWQMAGGQLWMDRRPFADAVARWLDEGPTT